MLRKLIMVIDDVATQGPKAPLDTVIAWNTQSPTRKGSIKYSMLLFDEKQFCDNTWLLPLIARFVGPTWGQSGADRTHVGPMLAPWTLLSEPHIIGSRLLI